MTDRGKLWPAKIVLALIIVQLSYFIISGLIFQHPQFGNRPFFWDEGAYWGDAEAVAKYFDFATIRNTSRPVPALPIVVLFKTFSLPITPHTMTLGVFFLTIVVGALGLRWLAIGAGAPGILLALAGSTILSMKGTAALSNTLMVDVYTGAIVLALVGSAVLFVSRPGYVGLSRLLVMSGAGLHSKPVVYPIICMTLALAALILVHQERSLRIWKTWPRTAYEVSSTAFGGIFFAASLALLSTRLPQLFADLSYVNNTLNYWVSLRGVWNGPLYLPQILAEELAVPQVLLLFFAGVAAACLRIGHTMGGRGTGVSAPHWLLCGILVTLTAGVSVFLQTKDGRITYFLLPLAVSAYFLLPRWPTAAPSFAAFAIVLATFNLMTQVSPAAAPWNVFSTHTLLNQQSTYIWTHDVSGALSYEQLGVNTLFNKLCSDVTSRETSSSPRSETVFVPHSSTRQNASLLWTYWRTQRQVLPDCPSNVDWNFVSGGLQYGGWGQHGGVPLDFFTADYVLFVVDDQAGHLEGQAELYNKSIANALSASDGNYMSGLHLVSSTHNAFGQELRILRRESLPDYEAYKAIVEEFAQVDGANAWNIPYLLSISSSSGIARKAIDGMDSDDFWKGVFYVAGMGESAKVYREALEKRDNSLFLYPSVITKGS